MTLHPIAQVIQEMRDEADHWRAMPTPRGTVGRMAMRLEQFADALTAFASTLVEARSESLEEAAAKMDLIAKDYKPPMGGPLPLMPHEIAQWLRAEAARCRETLPR